jgi:glucoamylase
MSVVCAPPNDLELARDGHPVQPQRRSKKKVVAVFAALAFAATAVVVAVVALGTNGKATGEPTAARDSSASKRAQSLDNYLGPAVAHAEQLILQAINPPNSTPGSLQAALSGTCPNYAYTWARDQALVYETLMSKYATLSGSDAQVYEDRLRDFATHTHTIFTKNLGSRDNDGDLWTLADAKVNNDGTQYMGGWCNPQNDGPALRAMLLIRFAERYAELHPGDSYIEQLYNSDASDGAGMNVIKRDLEYLYHNYDINNCEPWEERKGQHFYNRLMARRAFLLGAAYARKRGDPGAADAYEAKAQEVTQKLSTQHWNSGGRFIVTSVNTPYKGDGSTDRHDDVQVRSS